MNIRPRMEFGFPRWRGATPLATRTSVARAKLYDESPGLAEAVRVATFEEFDAVHRSQSPILGYRHVSPPLRCFMQRIPSSATGAWLCVLVLWYIDAFGRHRSPRFHPDIALQFNDSHHRIIDQIESNPAFADLDNDSFMKDLRIAQQSMIPAMAAVLWPGLRFGLRASLMRGYETFSYLRKCGGRHGFVELHAHQPMLKDYFNQAGWEETYRLAALFLASMPAARGVGSISWYYDPVVAQVSPRLAYLQARPLALGARIFYFNSSPDAVASALATSPTRRARFAEGQYWPKNYALAWSRDAILRHFGSG